MPPLASLKKRAIAFVLDLLIVITAVMTVWVVFWLIMAFTMFVLGGLLGSLMGQAAANNILKWVFMILWTIVATAFPIALFGYYFSRTESSTLQASIGKMLLGLRVVDEEGNRLDMNKAWWRAMNKLLSILVVFGFAPAFFNPEKQTLHDKMSGTLVVSK